MIAKNITLDSGFVCSHWQVVERIFDDLRQQASVTISGWKDTAAKQAGLQPARVIVFQELTGATFAALDGKTLSQVEAAVVQRIPAFAGGVVS